MECENSIEGRTGTISFAFKRLSSPIGKAEEGA